MSEIETPPITPRVPLVVALIGLPGAGKSLVAQAFVDTFGLRRVCRDTVRSAMFPSCSYSYAEKRAAMRGVLLAVEVNCMLGEGSVVDGVTFSRRRDLERLDATLAPYDVISLPLFLDCPPDIARQRVAHDIETGRHMALDRSPALVDEIMARFETPPATCVVLDARLPKDDLVAAALAAARSRMGLGAMTG